MIRFRFIFPIILCSVFLLLAERGFSASDSDTSPVTSAIISDLTVNQLHALDFGRVLVGASAGTVVVDDNGTQGSGGVKVAKKGREGRFKVRGAKSSVYRVSVPSKPFVITNGSAEMEVSITTSLPNNEGQLNPGGNDQFLIFGTLYVDANQPEGNYQGTYNISVNY